MILNTRSLLWNSNLDVVLYAPVAPSTPCLRLDADSKRDETHPPPPPERYHLVRVYASPAAGRNAQAGGSLPALLRSPREPTSGDSPPTARADAPSRSRPPAPSNDQRSLKVQTRGRGGGGGSCEPGREAMTSARRCVQILIAAPAKRLPPASEPDVWARGAPRDIKSWKRDVTGRHTHTHTPPQCRSFHISHYRELTGTWRTPEQPDGDQTQLPRPTEASLTSEDPVGYWGGNESTWLIVAAASSVSHDRSHY